MLTKIKIAICFLLIFSFMIVDIGIGNFQAVASPQLQSLNRQNNQIIWEEIVPLLDKSIGVYTERSNISDNTDYPPDGPLMGNSTVYAFLGSNSPDVEKKQYIYISKADGWADAGSQFPEANVHYAGFGAINIERTDSSQAVNNFRLEQDIKLAEATGISQSGFQSKTFLSAKENVMITQITSLIDQDMTMDISVRGISTANSSDTITLDEMKNIVSLTKSYESTIYSRTVNNTIAYKVLDKDVIISKENNAGNMAFSLLGKETVYLVTAIEGGKNSVTSLDDATATILAHDTIDEIDNARAIHRAWWKDYWMLSYVDLDSKSDLWEKIYLSLIYQSGCMINSESNNNAGLTVGLFPWTASGNPAWNGDYTMNTDIQRALHTSITANRTGFLENYVNIIRDFWPTAKSLASDPKQLNAVAVNSVRANYTKGIRGVLFPTHIGPWGERTEIYTEEERYAENYWCSPSNATHALQPLIKYYKSTLDYEFLTGTLYPMVKDVANFWTDYAFFNNATAKYDIYGSSIEGLSAYPNPHLDLAACYYMLGNAIELSNTLKLDTDLSQGWKEVYYNLSDFSYATEDGKEYYTLEEGKGVPNSSDLPWSVYGFSLFDLKGMSSDKREVTRVLNWLNNKQNWAGAKAYRAAAMAPRFGMNPKDYIPKLEEELINVPAGDWTGLRDNNIVGDTLFLATVQESLMQSHEGFISVFPSWWDNQAATFKNLRAYGAFTVSAAQNIFGQTDWVIINSEKGADCTVLNPWAGQKCQVYEDGKLIKAIKSDNLLGEVYTFKTKIGSSYEIKPSEELPPKIIFEKESLTLVKNYVAQLTPTTNSTKKIVWLSSDSEIAVVNNEGLVLGLKEGTTIIKATYEGTNISSECLLTITNNAALGQRAEANSVHDNFTADMAFDGKTTAPGNTDEGAYWVSANESSENPRWLMVDLGAIRTIKRWQTHHIITLGELDTGKSITRNYELQSSNDGTNWKTVDIVTNNIEIKTNRTLNETETARYFRLYITGVDQNNGEWPTRFARIDELELFVAENEWDIRAVDSISSIQAVKGTPYNDLELPNEVEVVLDERMTIKVPIEWNSTAYNGDVAGTYTLIGQVNLPKSIQNTKKLTASIQVVVSNNNIGNKHDLKELVTHAETIKKGKDYTNFSSTTRTEFERNLNVANALLEDESALQYDIDEAINNLQTAIDNLKKDKNNKIVIIVVSIILLLCASAITSIIFVKRKLKNK